MRAEATRTLKEARALLYPWCAVMMLCTFPLLSRPGQFMYFLFQTGILLGAPLLACLSFGNEFRHKTMELLVSQPVNRLKIWREKGNVVAIAVLTTTLVAGLTSRTPFQIPRAGDMDYVTFLVVTTCSAAFWTLLGRSTLGGLALNIASVILLFSAKTSLWMWNSSAGYLNPTVAILVLSAATLGYSAVMLWLGRWMLIHRQSSEGFAAPDVMASIPNVMPVRIASLFRCRPNQVILNLIRKELRLLRPLWLLTAIYIAGWSMMAVSFSFAPAVSEWQRSDVITLAIVTATYPIIAIFLAASLPLGEERAFGVQLWHLVLPLSIRTQWLIRLLAGLIASALCAIAVPAVLTAVARAVLRPEFMSRFEAMTFIEPIPALLAFFVFVFWCAIVVRDLTRTAGMVAASGGLIFIAVESSLWVTGLVTELIDHTRTFVISWYQLNPFAFNISLDWFPRLDHMPEWLLPALMCAVMTIHTYPLFRRLPQEGALKLVRPLVPYLAVIVMFVSLLTVRSWNGGWDASWDLFYETERAIVKLQPAESFSVEDLARVSPLPDQTKRWLRNSTMSVTVTDSPFDPNGLRKSLSFADWKVYNLTIRLSSGITCKASFPFAPDQSQRFFLNSGRCN